MSGRRVACVVANGTYEHAQLQRLRSPASDADALVEVLGNPEIAGFQVSVINDGTAHEVMAAIEDLLSDVRPDDLVLLHFSGHGLKDESGALFLAARNTRPDRLGSTAVPADFVQRAMNVCRARRLVLLLDCCYGGAFGRGARVRASGSAHVMEAFPAERMGGGRGRAVISASSSMEFAFEGDQLADGKQPPSVFTQAVVTGLRTGAADLDGDGVITLDELYDFVFDEVRAQNPRQSPTRRVDLEGDVVLATSVRGPVPPPISRDPDDGALAGAAVKGSGSLFITASVLDAVAALLLVGVLLVPASGSRLMVGTAQNLLPLPMALLVICGVGAVCQSVAASRPSWRPIATGLGGAAALGGVLLVVVGWWLESTIRNYGVGTIPLREVVCLLTLLSAYAVGRAEVVSFDVSRIRTKRGYGTLVAGALGGAGSIVLLTTERGYGNPAEPVFPLLITALFAIAVPLLSAAVGSPGKTLALGWAAVLLALIVEGVLVSDLAPSSTKTLFVRVQSDDALLVGLALLSASLAVLLAAPLFEKIARHRRPE